jgi:hypothetical protein
MKRVRLVEYIPPVVVIKKMSNLAFVHVTKTGGSAVEQWGLEHGYLWGVNDPSLKGPLKQNLRNKSGIPCTSPWHVPPGYFTKNPYSGRTTFTIVRNPYSRLVSEFYCPYAGAPNPDQLSPVEFNLWIHNLIHATPKIVSALPQVEYLPVDHILKYETLSQDFRQLMGDVDLDLPKLNTAVSSKYTTQDLDEPTKGLIRRVYARDFRCFGYPEVI